MGKKIITLSTQEELAIYMSPQRQQLLRTMHIHGNPITAKAIADKLKISASSIQHHIKKLMQLGLIEEDHTEQINGITARFFRVADVTVNIGRQLNDDLSEERDILAQNLLMQVYNGYNDSIKQLKENVGLEIITNKYGDLLQGIVHLKPAEGEELMRIISEYLEKHSAVAEGTEAWEYALITYNTKATGGSNDKNK